ncbi:hypothetical protein MOSE0_F02476 [Monosporozyma servazzii]
MVLDPMVTITAKGSSTVKLLTARCSGLGDLGEPGPVGGLLCKLQSAKQRCTVLYPMVTITAKRSSTVKISYYQRLHGAVSNGYNYCEGIQYRENILLSTLAWCCIQWLQLLRKDPVP